MRTFHLYVFSTVAVFLLIQPFSVAQAEEKKGTAYVAGELIIKLKNEQSVQAASLSSNRKAMSVGPSSVDFNALNRKYKVKKIQKLFEEKVVVGQRQAQALDKPKVQRPQNIYKIEMDENVNVDEAVADYAKDPNVVYVQPNYIAKINMTPNDPFYSKYQFDMAVIEANKAWDLNLGENVVVGVVDSGVDINHVDLAANIWTNPGEIPNNRKDDDGNGYVDDYKGWNFNGDNNKLTDKIGHGTHVAGTIAAVGNNKKGVIGVAPRAKIMPVKGLGDNGRGTILDLSNAIVYAAEEGAHVINNSWGCYDPCPSNPFAEEAVRFAIRKGKVVVFATGNSGDDTANYSPQNMSEVIGVGATNNGDLHLDFSNFGATVDVVAPGASIYSTTPGNRYAYKTGTSMAAPHVAGTVALMLARHPGLTVDEVENILRSSAQDIGFAGRDYATGYGRINTYRATLMNAASETFINSPTNGDVIAASRRNVHLLGTVKGEGLLRYELAYRLAGVEQWTGIGAPVVGQSVDNGPLGIWSVSTLTPGNYSLRLSVYFDGGVVKTSEILVQVNNTPPQLNAIPDKIVGERGNVHFTLEAQDAELENMVFSAQLANGDPLSSIGASIDAASGVFSWPSALYRAGGYVVIFTVTDAAGLSASRNAFINVVEGAFSVDLSIISLIVEPETLAPARGFKAKVVLDNSGTSTVNGGILKILVRENSSARNPWQKTVIVDSYVVGNINGQSSKEIEVNMPALSAKEVAYTISAEVDANNQMPETNELNNRASIIVNSQINGDIIFKVTTKTGQIIKEATVTINGESYLSNDAGMVSVSNLRKGFYPVTVSKSGYTSRSTSISISAGTQIVNRVISLTVPKK